MNLNFQDLIEIKDGLSRKKVFRKYEKKINKIVVDFSHNESEFYKFLNIYQILKKVNISIPKIYEVHIKKLIIIMEDFGDHKFDTLLNDKNIYFLLKTAVENLIIINNSLISDDLIKLEKYSFIHLKKEISEFVDYFIPYKKIHDFPINEFYDSWENIYNSFDFEYSAFNHKDYEFVNLIYLNKYKNHLQCGIIDFQSAFVGFIGWDLFSILENPRVNLTREYNEDLIKYFYDNVNMNIEFNSFRDQYYLLNLGRQTRLLGRWTKLFAEEKNKKYLKYMNTTQKRVISCMSNIKNNKLIKIYQKALISNA